MRKGVNHFTYVVQNPWTAYDPLGLQKHVKRNRPTPVSYYQHLQNASDYYRGIANEGHGSVTTFTAEFSANVLSFGSNFTPNGVKQGVQAGNDRMVNVGNRAINDGDSLFSATTQMIGSGVVDMTPIGSTVRATTGLDMGAPDGQTKLNGWDRATEGSLAVAEWASLGLAGKAGLKAPAGETSAQSIFISNRYGKAGGVYNPTDQTLKIFKVEAGETGMGYGTALYKQLLESASGDVKKVFGTAAEDNLAAIRAADGDINAAPRTKILKKEGYDVHTYDPDSNLMAAEMRE